MTEENTEKPVGKTFEVQWIVPPGPELFINQLLAQYDGDVVHLMVANTGPPAVVGRTEEEREKSLENITTIPALPVGRFAVPVEALRRMVQVLQKHLETIDTLPRPPAP
jgi:hypothetical protein